jgi:hypothetical protein
MAKPSKPSTRSVRYGRLALSASIAVLLVVGVYGGVRIATTRARQATAVEQARLLRSDRPEVRAAAANRLKMLGTDGIALLVDALAAEEEPTFRSALRAIDEQLDGLQHRSHSEQRQWVGALAAALDMQIDSIPPERRFAARRWAEWVIQSPMIDGSPELAETLAICERVVRSSPVTTEVAITSHEVTARNDAAPTPRRSPARTMIELEPFAAEGPAFIDLSVQPDPAADEDESEPSSGEAVQEKAVSKEPQRLVALNAQPIPQRKLTLTRPPPPRQPVDRVDEVAGLRDLSDLAVMRKLHDLDIHLTSAAEAELRRRGYRSIDLPICRAIVHPDPKVRRRLAENLPTMASVDARPWLMQLSEDEDADVRRAAEGILRTSRDPAVQRQLR